jgi:predicted RNA binding protein YcfA (HicA-like mRNA interferase family)
MSHLPVLSGKALCKILTRLGYEADHQTGSHLILRNRNTPYRRLTVPNHKEIAKGTLRSIIRESGLTVEEFQKLVDET